LPRAEISIWPIGKLTLPTDSHGRFNGKSIEVKNLPGYRYAEYFYTGSSGVMIFTVPVEEATASGSHFARWERHEMTEAEPATWTPKQRMDLPFSQKKQEPILGSRQKASSFIEGTIKLNS
jgi:hypothetical protein